MSRLLDQLRRRKEDRAMMAGLRCSLVESKKHRAWPLLHRLGVDVTNRVAAVVAALYATHPKEGQGNFGVTCRVIQNCRGDKHGDDNKLTPTERRFLHLLAAEKGDELCQRVTRMVLVAKSLDVPVNYEQLETDLKFWNDRTKADWARSFWTLDVDSDTSYATQEGAHA
ncbi:MAG: type I-E CRISPR-associated protein Cse2/CasB [Pirellulaceae bacterium]